MRHLIQLCFGGGGQFRVCIAMLCCPPRRHSINQTCAIFQFNIHPLRSCHRINRQRLCHGGVRMPNVLAVEGEINGHGVNNKQERAYYNKPRSINDTAWRWVIIKWSSKRTSIKFKACCKRWVKTISAEEGSGEAAGWL